MILLSSGKSIFQLPSLPKRHEEEPFYYFKDDPLIGFVLKTIINFLIHF